MTSDHSDVSAPDFDSSWIEEDLQQSGLQFTELLNAAGHAVVITDASQRIVLLNTEAEQCFQYQREELLGKTIECLLPERFAHIHQQHFQDFATLYEDAKPYHKRPEIIGRRKDGSEFPADVSIVKLRTTRQPLFVAILRDVTIQREVERTLKDRERFSKLVTTLSLQFAHLTSDHIELTIQQAMQTVGEFVAADRSFIIIAANPQKHSFRHEWCAEGIDPTTLNWDSFPPQAVAWINRMVKERQYLYIPHVPSLPSTARAIKEMLQSQGIMSSLILPLQFDGEIVGYLGYETIHASATWSEDTIALLKIVGEMFVNVMQRRQMEQTIIEKQKLEIALEKERELSKLRSQFITTVSHEFRTPLASIQLSMDLIRRYNEQLEADRREKHFDTMQRQIEHMTDLLEDVVLIRDFETDTVKFAPIKQNLTSFCRQIIDSFRHTFGHHYHFSFTAPSPDIPILFDSHWMYQVVRNLLSNAIKYSESDSTIRVELSYDQDQATLLVQDEGIGIPLHEQEHLFQPFFRSDNIGEIGGTGLGLAIAKRAVELHGGQIICHSNVGDGTTFTVTLPRSV